MRPFKVLLGLTTVMVFYNPPPAVASDTVFAPQAEVRTSKVIRTAVRLCSVVNGLTELHISTDDIHDTISDMLDEILIKYSGVNENSPSYRRNLADFFNANSHHMICSADESSGFPAQHLFHRAILNSTHDWILHEYFFSDPEGFPINPNTITVNQYDQDQTVLDYLDSHMESIKTETSFVADYSDEELRRDRRESIAPTIEFLEVQRGGLRSHQFDYSDQIIIPQHPANGSERLPSEKEVPVACSVSVPKNFQEKIDYIADWLGYEHIAERPGDPLKKWQRQKRFEAGPLSCFQHRDFGLIYRQTVETTSASVVAAGQELREEFDSIYHVVYWLDPHDKESVKSDIFD